MASGRRHLVGVVVLSIALPMAACTPRRDAAAPTTTTTPTVAGGATTSVARRINKFTGGDGGTFCQAFNRATDIIAVGTVASLGHPESAGENELVLAPALLDALRTMADSSPRETSAGVSRWIDRTAAAVDGLRQSGADAGTIESVAKQVLDFRPESVRRGRLAEQIVMPIDPDRLAAAATSFTEQRGPLDTFVSELSGSLGGELVGKARDQAIAEFPCLAALDERVAPDETASTSG